MKRLSVAEWSGALDAYITSVPQENIVPAVTHFVTELRRRRALRFLPRIMRAFAARRDADDGTLTVQTCAARELPPSIEKELHTLAPHVTIQHTVDPHLIGGIRIAYQDKIIDGTVAARLTKLYEA